MNILLINHYAGSSNMGMEMRPYYMAKEWIKLGHNVTIIAGDYSHLRKHNPIVFNDFQENVIEQIRYVWVKTGKYKGNGIARAKSMFRFILKMWINAKKICVLYKPDVVIASSTYPLDTFVAQKIRKICGAKYIHEIHDMWPATLIELGGMSKHNPFVAAMQIGENSFCKNADKVVSLLPASKDYLIKHGMNEKKFYWIPNGIVMEEWDNPEPLNPELEQKLMTLKKKGFKILGYSGGHALSNNLEPLIEVAAIFQNKKLKVFLVGDGVEKKHLMGAAKTKGVNNIFFVDSIPKKQIPNLLKCFDYVYIGAHKSPLYRFGVSLNKLFDYMMSGKPILYAVESENDYVQQYNCGEKADPDSIDSIVEALEKLLSMRECDITELGNRAQKAVKENFQYKDLAEQFIKIMQEV